jgi:hypothetical protein
MKNNFVATGSASRESTPFKDLTNTISEPSHAGISTKLIQFCHYMLVLDIYFSSFVITFQCCLTGDHTPDSGLTSVPNSKNSTSWYGRLSAEKKRNTWRSYVNHGKRKGMLL